MVFLFYLIQRRKKVNSLANFIRKEVSPLCVNIILLIMWINNYVFDVYLKFIFCFCDRSNIGYFNFFTASEVFPGVPAVNIS